MNQQLARYALILAAKRCRDARREVERLAADLDASLTAAWGVAITEEQEAVHALADAYDLYEKNSPECRHEWAQYHDASGQAVPNNYGCTICGAAKVDPDGGSVGRAGSSSLPPLRLV